jgi:putative redox protein
MYEGDLHCRLIHEPSGREMVTDAPKDNLGRGESFSPTDLVAAALGSCMMTTMGIYAARQGIELAGTKIEVTKEMISGPDRRIGKLATVFHMPPGLPVERRGALERASMACPVHKNLNPEVETSVIFQYPD